MRVLRTFPPDLVRFVMESCKQIMDEYVSKQSRIVTEEKKPNTFLSVGKITRGVYCPSMRQHRWILPLARFQLADFERIHEELGIYAREIASPRG